MRSTQLLLPAQCLGSSSSSSSIASWAAHSTSSSSQNDHHRSEHASHVRWAQRRKTTTSFSISTIVWAEHTEAHVARTCVYNTSSSCTRRSLTSKCARPRWRPRLLVDETRDTVQLRFSCRKTCWIFVWNSAHGALSAQETEYRMPHAHIMRFTRCAVQETHNTKPELAPLNNLCCISVCTWTQCVRLHYGLLHNRASCVLHRQSDADAFAHSPTQWPAGFASDVYIQILRIHSLSSGFGEIGGKKCKIQHSIMSL